jgi:hypothetical protein
MAQTKPQRTKREPYEFQAESSAGRPDVIVEFLFDRGLLFIAVNNIGDQPALAVSVKFNKKILGPDGKKEISALPMFDCIQFLGPKREIVTFLDASDSYFRRKQPTKIIARVSYNDRQKQKYEATINHDLEIYRELAYLVPSPEGF